MHSFVYSDRCQAGSDLVQMCVELVSPLRRNFFSHLTLKAIAVSPRLSALILLEACQSWSAYSVIMQSIKNLPCAIGAISGLIASTKVRPPTSVVRAKSLDPIVMTIF